jgi:hypothetical protein
MAMTPDERRAIIGCVFASACILLAPGEFRAAGFLGAVTAILSVRHVVLSRRESVLAKAARPVPLPPSDAPEAVDDAPAGSP